MTPSSRKGCFCWMDGEFLPPSKELIPLDDRGVLLADGIFDTILIESGKAHYLQRHLNRLKEHASHINLSLPESFEHLDKIISKLIGINELGKKRASVRTTITRGSGPRGLTTSGSTKSRMIVKIHPGSGSISRASSSNENTKGISLVCVPELRRNEFSLFSQIKSLNYAENVMAMMLAQQKGADNALLLNTQGDLCCAANGNIYYFYEGGWKTPPLEDGVLDGTIRQILIDNNKAEEESFHYRNIDKVEAMAFSNSLYGLLPVHTLDEQKFENTRLLQNFENESYELEF